MAVNNWTTSCRILVTILFTLCLCFIPSVRSESGTELAVDNVLFTRLEGLPLVEQQEETLRVGVMIGTTNVPAETDNGVEVSHMGPFRIKYTLASGTDASNAVELTEISNRSTATRLYPGTLFPYEINDLDVSLTSYGCDDVPLLCVEIISEQAGLTLIGATKGCIQITCRGVVITYIEPVVLETSTLRQGLPNNNVSLTVSFQSDSNYASVSGTDLWDPWVFGNGNQFGTSLMINATPTLTAVTNYGINNEGTSVWPELGVMIDLTMYGCPEARYICVNPKKNDSQVFSLGFIPQSAQYGCVEVDCAGVEFIGGTITKASEFAEFRGMHTIKFDVTFNTDPTKGGVIGNNLWKVKAYLSLSDDTASTASAPITQADADLFANSVSQDLAPGDQLVISGAKVELDLSSVSCNSLYLCLTVERDSNSIREDGSPLDFDINSYIVCQQLECIGLVIKTLTLTQHSSQEQPLLEFVSGLQDFVVDLTIDPDLTSGGVMGDNLWMFEVFFSDMDDCSNPLTPNAAPTVIPGKGQTGQDVGGQQVTIEDLLVRVDLSTSACSNTQYMCLNLNLTNSASDLFQPVTGQTTASLLYNCKGIELTSATVELQTPSPPEITERAPATLFTVDLIVNAGLEGGSAIGDDLWTAELFFSTDENGIAMELVTEADSGDWRNEDVVSGQMGTLATISATIDLDSTCENMRFLCVQLSKNQSASFKFDVNNNERVACLEILEMNCHGVEINATDLRIASPINVIENTGDSLTAELFLTGNSTDQSAPLSGEKLWRLNVFTSSDGISKDGGINFLHNLNALQEDTVIASGAGFDFTGMRTIDVTFDMTDRPCDENNYLCVEILKGTDPDPAFSLTGNTIGCTNLNCKGIIVTNTNTTITLIPNGGALVEGFPSQAVDLQVALTTDTGAGASGTGLWQLDVFTNAFENGTGEIKRFDTTLISGSWIDTAVPSDSTTSLVVPVMVDLSGQLCMDVNYLCVRIREGIMPSPNITLQSSTGPENFVGCAPVTCETAGVENNAMTFIPSRVVEHQVAPQPFTVSVSYISESGRGNITGTNLWSLKVFFSDSENGTNPSIETQVDLGPLTDAPFYSGQTLEFNDLTLNVPLTDLVCHMSTYFCTQLGKGDPSNTDYSLEIRPACQPIQCAGVALNSTQVSVSTGQLLFEYQSSQSSSLDVTLNSLPEGASIEGTDLWNFTVFLSNSDTMFTDREAVMTTSIYTSSGSPLVAGTPLTIQGVQPLLDLDGVGCSDFRYICVQVDVGSMPMTSFNLDLQVPNANIACAPVDCRGVLISSSNLNLIEGDLLIERTDKHDVTFDVSLQFSDESTNIYGEDLWQATIFTNTRMDCGDTPCTSSQPIVLNGGNVTRGRMVTTDSAVASLDMSQCTCPQMQYLCVLITMNPGASINFTLESPMQGFRDWHEVTCTGVVIDGVDLMLPDPSSVILYEADTNPTNVTASVTLTVANVSAVIDEGAVTNIWQIELYPKSDPVTYRVPATLTQEQLNQGLNKSDTLTFNNLFFEFNTFNFVCPEGGTEELCVEVSTSPSINPNVSIAFQPNGTDCVSVQCRGVQFDNLIVAGETDTSFVEFESMHRITFNISANTTENSTNIANGVNLWQVRVYGSLYMNGTGERYSETQIPIDDTTTVTAGSPVEYSGLVWDMDLTNFTCPSTNQFYMCVQLMPARDMPMPRFSMSPRPLKTCVEIDCTGVMISTLDLTVNSGDPVLERQSNDVNLTITATSSEAGSSINGNNLWKLTILVCERDNCVGIVERRDTNSDAIVEVTVNLTTMSINEDLAAGGSITFSNIAETLDLMSLEQCPASEMVYICVQLDKGDAASPDFTLQGELLTCQPVKCRGVHILSSVTSNQVGGLQEGNPSNAVELDFTFTADTVSSDVSGTNLWDIQIYGSNSQNGDTSSTEVTLGDIGSTTNAPLSASQTIEFFKVTATLDLSPNITCQEGQYVCGRLIRRATASQVFSVTGEKTACYLYTCTGVHISGTTVEILYDGSLTEGQAIVMSLNVTLDVDSTSSNLFDVMDAWRVEVFGNPQMNGLGVGGTGRFIANTSFVSPTPITPGNNLLVPVVVSFDLSSGYCKNIKYLCVEVQRGVNANPPFKLNGVPSDFEGLYDCTEVNCIGVRISNSSIEDITKGNPVLQGNSAFEVELDVDYGSDTSGADVSGENIFGVKLFLSAAPPSILEINGEMVKYTADIPEGSQSATLVAGEQLNINRASVSISTEGLVCPIGGLYLCAELFPPANASYLLNGFNSSAMMVENGLLTACEMVECRDVRFDNMTLSPIDPPYIIERTANQILSVNVTVEPNATWSNASGNSLWMMSTIIKSAGQVERMESIVLSTDNANMDIVAGTSTTFPDVALSLDLSSFLCPDAMVELCVSINTNPSSNFSLSGSSTSEACLNIPCKVTEVDSSDYEIFYPPNILEYMMNNLRFAVSLTAGPVSASIAGDELWRVVKVYMSGYAEGNDSVAADTSVPLLSSQDEVGISAGETIRLLNIEASLNLQDINCASMPYLCVEVAKGDAPIPEFNVSFNDNSNIICKENIRCQGIVITQNSIQSPQQRPDATEGREDQLVNITVAIEHDPDLGTSTGTEMYPWMVTVFYNGQWDCSGDDFGDRVPAGIVDHQMLVDNEQLVFENLEVQLNLTQLICPETDIYLCAEFEKNTSAASDYTLKYQPPTARYAVQQVACHGVEISATELTLTGGIQHTQADQNHEITFSFTVNSSETSRPLSGSNLWSFLMYGSRNSDGSGGRVINHVFSSDLSPTSLQPGGTYELDSASQMLNLSFEDITCVEMPYLCLEIRKSNRSSVDFSLWGVPNGLSLRDCFKLDCRGVYIDEFNVTLTAGDEIIYENRANELTAVNLGLSSSMDNEGATGTNLWDVSAFFSDAQDGSGEVIARTQVTPLPGIQGDQDFPAGGQISFGPLDLSLTLPGTCENVMYLCFELQASDAAVSPSSPILLGSTVSCVPVDCRGVVIASTTLRVNPADNRYTETEGPISFVAIATVMPHPDSADIAGTNLWSLDFYLSDSSTGNTSFARAPFISASNPLSVGSAVTFSEVPVFNASEVLCYEALYLCVGLKKNSGANPDFGLKGLPDDSTLVDCFDVKSLCIGVVVASTDLEVINNPVLLSGEPTMELGPLIFRSTFATQTRNIANGNDFFRILILARDGTGQDIELDRRPIAGPTSNVESSGMINFPFTSLVADLTGIRCDQMTSVCGVLQKGSNPDPGYTLQGQGGDLTLLEDCVQLQCRGVQVNSLFVNFVSGVPLLEDTASHEVIFTLSVESSSMGASALGDDLWSLTTFLSRYENGSDPISRKTASIADDANMDLTAGGSIDIAASVNLNATDLVCDNEFLYLCVVLSKGDAVNPDYTLEGVGAFGDLQVCQPFACKGVNLISPDLNPGPGQTLLNFDPMLELTVDVSVDVDADSATVSGQDLWHFEFFTSTDSDGNVSPSPRAMPSNLTSEQGSVSLIAGETSVIEGVNVVLNLSSTSCDTGIQFLCVEIWRGQRAFPFYTINSPASQSQLRKCIPITCLGVKLLSVAPVVITPPIWIEDLANQTITLEIILMPDPTFASIVGENLFQVDVFASASNTGTEPQISLVTVPVSNAYASNLEVNRFQNNTLMNVQAVLDFTGYSCSDLGYIFVDVRKGPNAFPNYKLEDDSNLGFALQPCAGVIVNSVVPTLNLGSNEILEGDSAHTFTFSADAVTGNGIPTGGTQAWQIEVFVSLNNEGTNPLRSVVLEDLTAPSAPNSQIEFSNLEATLNLSGLTCNEFRHFCAHLSVAPGANFSLSGTPTDSVLLGCIPQRLNCRGTNPNLRVQDFTDTTLTVEWDPSIGDFDSYLLNINPADGPNPYYSQIKSVGTYMYTFTGLTPGDKYTVTIQLTKGAMEKGPLFIHLNAPTTLLPSCPALEIPASEVTSMEIVATWPRPEGYANVESYSISITPSTDVTFESEISNPFTATNDEHRQVFSSLTPAQTYVIEVTANAIMAGPESPAGCNSRTVVAKPAAVVLQVADFNTTSVSLAWSSPLSVTPDGYVLTIDILSAVADTAPAPVDIPGTNTAYVVPSLLPGVEYSFTVQAYQNVQSTRAFGDADTVMQQTTPVPPENIAIEVTETTATITYEAPLGFHSNFTHSLLDAGGNVVRGPDGSNEFSVEYMDLTAGTMYTYRVLSNAGLATSKAVLQTFTSRPIPPGIPEPTFVDETTIIIQWAHNEGERDGYEVSYSPNSTSYTPQTPQYVIENRFVLTGLDPYTTIQFDVRTVINSVTSTPTTWRQRTFAARPNMIENLMIVTTSASSVNVVFNVPAKPNGLITGYLISYNGMRNTATSSGNQFFSDIHPNDVRVEVPIASLNPGYVYQFSVQAVNGEGTSDAVIGEVTLVAGDPVPSGNGINSQGATASSSATTITIVINDNLFSDVNGAVIALQVFVAEEHASNTDRTIADPPLRYQQVRDFPFRTAYVTSPLFAPTPFRGRRKRQIADTLTTYTIGSERECVSEDSICNGPLEPLTSYRVLVRAYTDGGFADSPWSEPISTRALDSWFTIPIIIYGVVIFFILIFLLLCCLSSGRHGRKKVKSSPGPRKARGFHSPQQESRFNDNHNNSSSRHPRHSKAPPITLSRPILSAQFPLHYNEMVADKQHKFTMEFDDLRNIGQDLSKSEGRSAENKNKNRFGNILPFNETRVQLSGSPDYINANYITGFNKSQEYIATQGPMSNTVHEFWRMVWEKECPAIVMLVRCIEGGKEKCDKYWPINSDPTVFGKVIVTKLAEHNHDTWTVRDFRLKVGSEERLIRQYHFTSWPTHSTPRVSRPTLNFVKNIREELESPKLSGPLVVHCGAGIGRTGVFIALDILLQELKADERTVDVFAVVAKMRRERCSLVQSLVQYIFLHRALADFLQGQGHGIEVSSIERSDAGSIQSDEIEQMSNTSL